MCGLDSGVEAKHSILQPWQETELDKDPEPIGNSIPEWFRERNNARRVAKEPRQCIPASLATTIAGRAARRTGRTTESTTRLIQAGSAIPERDPPHNSPVDQANAMSEKIHLITYSCGEDPLGTHIWSEPLRERLRL
jgi:hypothetical protein